MTRTNPQPPVLTPTHNPDWGYWGTMAAQAEQAWSEALLQTTRATGQPAEAVRAFLDSSFGRHFANHVLDQCSTLPLAQAITKATQAWMAAPIASRPSQPNSTNKGTPQLTKFVIQQALADEAAKA